MALVAEDIRRRLRGRRLGQRIECLVETESTNSDVAKAARAGMAEGYVVLADSQRRGRGRLGRSWFSPPGLNLYLSILLRPELRAAEVPCLALVAGMAVADCVDEFAGEKAAVKWPNDVLLAGRKVAGVLTEAEVEAGRAAAVVVGIGVNLNARAEDFPPEVRELATSIRIASGREVDRAAFAARLIDALDARYESLQRDGFSSILAAWPERDALRGRRVQVRTGASLVSGVGAGLAPSGRLRLETETGVEEILAGDVTIVNGYSREAAR